MKKNAISQYVRTMYEESRDGELTVGDLDDRFDCPVDWDADTADALAQQCGAWIEQLTELAGRYDELLADTSGLTDKQLYVWNTFLCSFPDHGLDQQALCVIGEKEAVGLALTEKETELARKYSLWFDEQALTRLPYNRCNPADLIYRAVRYAKLVRYNAPTSVLESEAQRFAEEFVLYHCMKQ